MKRARPLPVVLSKPDGSFTDLNNVTLSADVDLSTVTNNQKAILNSVNDKLNTVNDNLNSINSLLT